MTPGILIAVTCMTLPTPDQGFGRAAGRLKDRRFLTYRDTIAPSGLLTVVPQVWYSS